MDTTISASSQTSLTNTSTGDVSAHNYYVARWVSNILYQGKIDANTWDFKTAMSESNTNANFPRSSTGVLYVNCYVWKPSTGTKVGTILDGNTASDGEESGTGQTLIECTFTGAAVTGITPGDAVIVFEIWAQVTQAMNGTYTQTVFYDGTTESSTSNNASYINTPENLQFAGTAANMTVIGGAFTGVSTANTTQYLPITGSLGSGNFTTTEADVQIPIRKKGTLSKLGVRISANGVTGNSTYTVRKNGADTGLVITFGSSATGYFEDLVNTVSVSPGDKISIKTVPGGASGTFTHKTIRLHFTAEDGSTTSILGSSEPNSYAIASATRYYPIEGRLINTSTEANVKAKQRVAGTYANLAVYISSNSRTTDTTFKTRKNGVAGIVITVPAGQTGLFENTTDIDTVAVDDDYNFAITSGSGTEGITPTFMKVEFTNMVTRGVFSVGNSGSSNQTAANETRELPLIGSSNPLVTTTEYRAKIRNSLLILYDLHVNVDVNTVSANSTATLLVNGTATALTCTLTASTTGLFTDKAHAVIVGSNDELTIQIAAGASGTVIGISLAQIYYRIGPVADSSANATTNGSGGGGIASTANTTQYWPFTGRTVVSSTETDLQIPIREPGIIKNLQVRLESSSTSGGNTTYTVRKNATDTSLVATAGAAATGVFEDLVNYVSVLPGDKICVKSVPPATGTFTLVSVGFMFIPDDPTKSVQLLATVFSTNLTSASATTYHTLNGSTGGSGTEANAKVRQRQAGDYKNMFIVVTANARTTDTTFRTRKNGANGNISITVAAGQTGIFENTANVDTVASGDDFNFSIVTGTGTETLTFMIVGIHFINTVYHGLMEVGTAAGATVNANVTQYFVPNGTISAHTTESRSFRKIRHTKIIIKDLFVYVEANGVTADSTVTLRKNSADTTLIATITNATTGLFSDTTHQVEVSANDDIGIEITTGASGTSLNLRVVVLYYTTGRISKQFMLPYNITVRISKQFRFLFNIQQRISKQFRFPYNIVGRISKQFRFPYNIQQRISKIFRYPYNIVGRISKQFRFPYNIIQRTSKQFRFVYNILERISKQFRFPYNIQQSLERVSKTFRFPYNIVQRTSKQFRFPYNIVARISKQFRFPYNITVIISKTFRFPYNIQQRISKQFRFPYNIVQRISKQFRYPYNIQQRISKQFRFPYNIQQRISKQFRFVYNVIQRISKQFRYPYNITVRISKQFRFPYNILGRVSKEFTFLYNIVSEGIRVSKTFRFPYNIVGRTSKQFRFPYNITVRISKTFRYPYNIQQRISKQFRFPYNIIARISKQFRFLYNITERVSKTFQFPYNILSRVSKQFRFPYNIISTLIRVSKTFRFPYNIQQRVSKTFTFPYNIHKPIRRITDAAGAFTVKLKQPTRGIAKMLWDRMHDGFYE